MYTNETDIIDFLDICNINWASYSGGPSIGDSNTLTIQDESEELSQGLATYECTITPNTNSEFIVGESVTKQYFVNVCPWKIELKYYGVATPDGFDNKTLEGGVTYFPKLTNVADGATSSDVTYSVYGEGYSINSLNVIQAPRASTNEQKATIKASLNGKEIASLDVVVPAKENSGTSGGTTGGETSTYQIGDVYSENGTAMGVVFEVAEDNSYIKIVALNESPDNLMFAKSGYLQTSDSDFFLFDDDGYGNFDGLYYQVLSEKIEGIENYPAFDYCYSYYVNDYDNELWVLPAIEELIAIVQTNINVINQTLNNGNYTQISTSFGYWSSTMVEGTTKAYYCTSLGGKQSYNVTTSCVVRPILRIDFED